MNQASLSFTEKLPGGLAFDLLFVEGGSFSMGSEEGDPDAYGDEKEAHEVTVPGFYMGKYPVTQALWQQVMGLHPSYFSGPGRPVEQVSWYDALVFCNRLSVLTGREACYFLDKKYKQVFGLRADGNWALPEAGKHYSIFHKTSARGYRLPTEAEWDYAARGGACSEGYRYAGSDKLAAVGWHDDNSGGETQEAGLKTPNELGLYDMSGNVWEWCEDEWHSYTADAPRDGAAWVDSGEEGSFRVMRGGSWDGDAEYCRLAGRDLYWPDYRFINVGFRLALSVSAPVQKK